MSDAPEIGSPDAKQQGCECEKHSDLSYTMATSCPVHFDRVGDWAVRKGGGMAFSVWLGDGDMPEDDPSQNVDPGDAT